MASNSTSSDTFDLLYGKNKQFRISFDFYTPRAHYIILPKVRMAADFKDLKEESKEELIRSADLMVDQYTIKNGIFVLHRGSWVTTKHKFHSHVCDSVDAYLKVFRQKESEISDWPDQKFVTNTWKKSKDPRKYEVNVRGYPYSSYFSDDIKMIRQLKTRSYDFVIRENHFRYGGSDFTLMMHPSQPLIGFCCDQSTAKGKVLQAMENVMQKYVISQKVPDSYMAGGHLCLLYKKGQMDMEFPGLGAGKSVVGYIHLNPAMFYFMETKEKREEWFTNFQKKEVPIYT